MKILRSVLEKEGWHLNSSGLPIQVGIKFSDLVLGKRHLHRSMHEYFLVLEGNIALLVEGEEITLEKGDLIVVEPGESHEICSKSPAATLLLIMPKPVPNDKVELD